MMTVAIVAGSSLAVFAITFALLVWLGAPERPEPDAPFLTRRERLKDIRRRAALLCTVCQHQASEAPPRQPALAQIRP